MKCNKTQHLSRFATYHKASPDLPGDNPWAAIGMEKSGTATYMWPHERDGMDVRIRPYARGWAT